MAAEVVPVVETRARARLLDLALIFARISSTAFGGAAVVMMRRELIARRGWLTEREFLEIYAVAQICPGGLPISLAVLCGKRLAGIPGFFVALVAETVPGFVVLVVLALLSFDPHMALLRAALRGAAAAAVGSLLANAIQMNWPYRRKVVDLALVVTVALSVALFHLSLWWVFCVFLPLSIFIVRMRGEV